MDKYHAKKALEYFGIFTSNCSQKELKKIYFEKIKSLHPDVHSGENVKLQSKYKNDFLNAHHQYQIAYAFLKEKEENEQHTSQQTDNPKYHQQKTFTNFSKFNDSCKKKKNTSFRNSVLWFCRFTSHTNQRIYFFILKKKYLLCSVLFFFYFLFTTQDKYENIKQKETTKQERLLDAVGTEEDNMTRNNKEQDASSVKTNVPVHKANNDQTGKTVPLSKKRYIFNVVQKHKKKGKKKQIDDAEISIKQKKNSVENYYEMENIIKDITLNSLDLEKKTGSYFSYIPKRSYNITHEKSILQTILTLLKKEERNTSLNMGVSTTNLQLKNRKKEKEKKKKILEKAHVPLYEDFLNNENRGEHNESRYINGVGGLCGGNLLIKRKNHPIETDDFVFKDSIYMKEFQKKQLWDKSIKLQNLIIYEKMKYIDFFNPLKRAPHNEKWFVQLRNQLQHKNCVIPLNKSAFQKKMQRMKSSE